MKQLGIVVKLPLYFQSLTSFNYTFFTYKLLDTAAEKVSEFLGKPNKFV